MVCVGGGLTRLSYAKLLAEEVGREGVQLAMDNDLVPATGAREEEESAASTQSRSWAQRGSSALGSVFFPEACSVDVSFRRVCKHAARLRAAPEVEYVSTSTGAEGGAP